MVKFKPLVWEVCEVYHGVPVTEQAVCAGLRYEISRLPYGRFGSRMWSIAVDGFEKTLDGSFEGTLECCKAEVQRIHEAFLSTAIVDDPEPTRKKSSIDVVVFGRAGAGKSTIAAFVYAALKRAGVETVLQDDDSTVIRKDGNLGAFAQEVKVRIITQQRPK